MTMILTNLLKSVEVPISSERIILMEGPNSGLNMRGFNGKGKVTVRSPLYVCRSPAVTPWLIKSDLSSGLSRPLQDLIISIRDFKYREVAEDVLGAIKGPPSPRDPNLVELGVASFAFTRLVIHLTNPWSIKEGNGYQKGVRDPLLCSLHGKPIVVMSSHPQKAHNPPFSVASLKRKPRGKLPQQTQS